MKTKNRFFMSILLALAICIGALTGCAGTSDGKTNIADEVSPLKATCIGTIPTYDKIISGHVGWFYKDSDTDLYGIIGVSKDGVKKTDAVFSYLLMQDKYYVASKTASGIDYSSASGINTLGLYDGDGNQLIPDKYAEIDCCSEYFAIVTTVTGTTDSAEDSVYSYTDSDYLTHYYSGKKELYCLADGKTASLSFIAGTQWKKLSVYDSIIQLRDANGDEYYVNRHGNEITALRNESNTIVLENGTYIAYSKGSSAAVMSDEGSTLFTFNSNEYSIFRHDNFNLCYVANSHTVKDAWILLDDTGATLTDVIGDGLSYYCRLGDIIICSNYNGETKYFACDKTGKSLCEQIYDSKYIDRFQNTVLFTTDTGKTLLLNSQGKTIAEFDSLTEFAEPGVLKKETDSSTQSYYSYKDSDFTLKGEAFGPYSVIGTDGALYDTVTNKKLIDNLYGNYVMDGYYNFSYRDIFGYYCLADNTDGTTSVYYVTVDR